MKNFHPAERAVFLVGSLCSMGLFIGQLLLEGHL